MINTAKLYYIQITLLLVLMAASVDVNGQDDDKPTIPLDHFYAKPQNVSALRILLSKLHFGFSTGYGRTFYKQNLDDYAILQLQDSTTVLFDKNTDISGGAIPVGYNYWFNTAKQVDSVAFTSSDYLISSDSSDLTFRAPGTSIPLMATIHVEFMEKYKIGGGFMFEYHRPGKFSSKNFSGDIASITPDFGSTFYKKYFLILGAKVYRYYEYTLAVDAEIGAFKLSKKFNKSLIQKGVFVNVGATIERELSEYFTAFIRPSYDIKNYTINLPESSSSVSTSMNAFYLGVGITYRIPELRKCFIKECTTQVNHQHGNAKYRSRMHPFYKKQNPHHGENFPKLFRNKRKNKNKMNAY
ncbi:MAG TPA: hypothetical protein PKL31_01600 [Fulvivirga sp.]|nr:hypothetical protein [Fulvivirga sp.]